MRATIKTVTERRRVAPFDMARRNEWKEVVWYHIVDAGGDEVCVTTDKERADYALENVRYWEERHEEENGQV